MPAGFRDPRSATELQAHDAFYRFPKILSIKKEQSDSPSAM